ncbi:MAG: leucyl aminopeptidase, partial [Phenylobacterium sp.]|nr:leucyl aminopeptidase [Phenylobacterium sp.]
ALVGKGVTFDTGGISIKAAAGLDEMKWDMGGAAVIAGAMVSLAARRAPANVVAVLGLVENMVDGAAQRPGDVVRSMSGQTIEVVDTDAEGRLVLADALWYAHTRFRPQASIDVGTLTGAVMVALGEDYGGLFCEDEALAEALLAAGRSSGDRLWRLPMPETYDRHIETPWADVRNVALGIGRQGGASIAARFLRRFAGDASWAHLDISAPIWNTKAAGMASGPGIHAFGVRLLDALVRQAFEDGID